MPIPCFLYWFYVNAFILLPALILSTHINFRVMCSAFSVLISAFASAEPGRLMAKFYMKFGTMKDIVKAPEGCTLADALHIVCNAEELSCTYIE